MYQLTEAHAFSTSRTARLAAVLVLAGLVGLAGCDRDAGSTSEQASAQQPAPTAEESAKPGSDEHEEHGHDEEHGEHDEHADGDEHGHHDAHLGGQMYELSRRFSAIWFAGKAGNKPMVKYQVHEMEEVIEEIEKSAPTENGVDVAERLQDDVGSRLEALEESVGSDEDFEQTYRAIMGKCGTCHTQTNHGFIQPRIPEYNPYPNVKMEP